MATPWRTIHSIDTAEGVLQLRQRGASDFLITIDGRVLMNSASHRSEAELARLACSGLKTSPRPGVLISGLGMAFTLRAALDCLPLGGRVKVVELNPQVVEWCRGPLASLTGRALEDPRVTVEVADVCEVIARPLAGDERYGAVIFDLFEGPDSHDTSPRQRIYGKRAVRQVRAALTEDGLFAVWAEQPDSAFEQRLAAAGFKVQGRRSAKGGYRYWLYLARPGRRCDEQI